MRLGDLSKSKSPGPATYHPFLKGDDKDATDRLDPIRRKAPDFTFGGARYTIDKSVSPSPNTYDLRHVKGITGERGTAISGRKAPVWGMGERRLAPPMIIAGDNS